MSKTNTVEERFFPPKNSAENADKDYVKYRKSIARQTLLYLLTALVGSLAFAEEPSDCRGYFHRLGAKARLLTGRGTKNLDPESYAIFEKIRLQPTAELSAAEQTHLKTHGLLDLLHRYRQSGGAVKQVNNILAIVKRASPMPGKDRARYKGVTDWFLRNVFPGLPIAPSERARRIFERALQTNNFSLSTKDQDFLRRWSLLEDFSRFQRESLEHRQGFLVMSQLNLAKNIVKWTVIVPTTIGGTIAPLLGSETLGPDAADDQSLVAGPGKSGTVHFYIPARPDKPAILRFEKAAVVFNLLETKARKGDEITALEKTIRENGDSYTRVELSVSPKEREKLLAAALEYVSRRFKDSEGTEKLSQRFYYDLPTAEVYRLLQNHLQLPPAPFLTRDSTLLLSYISFLRLLEKPGEGRVRRVVQLNGEPGSMTSSDAAKTALRALNFYLTSLGLTQMTGIPLSASMLLYDSKPTTLHKNIVLIPPKQPDKP